MKSLARLLLGVLLVVPQAVLVPSAARACTGLTIRPADGSIVFGRTLEFGTDLRSNVIIVPRGQQYVGSTPDGQPGLRFTTKYGIAGTNAFGLPVIMDGLNEKGLAVGLFYFPGYAKYPVVTPAEAGKSLAPYELGVYLLGTCATVDEAVAAARQTLLGNVVLKGLGIVPPVHYIVNDASGRSVVIEPVDGELKIYDNPLGVITNAPGFDWHVTNLGNYVNLTPFNITKAAVGPAAIRGFGQGTGMLGLPGDFTPPSRFVRAFAFSQTAEPVRTGDAGVVQAFHLLNQFDIPRGAARGFDDGQEEADYTQWTGVSELRQRKYYFRTFANSRIRVVDLMSADLDAPRVKTISMQGGEAIENVTSDAK